MKTKKKIWCCLFSLLWMFVLIFPVMASEIPSERQKPLLVDEACLLTEEEKIALCDVVSRSRAEFIKTSTGFAGGGATLADIRLFKKYVTGDTKIKAAGGIKSVADAEAFLAAGAERLGSSSLLAMLRQEIKQ